MKKNLAVVNILEEIIENNKEEIDLWFKNLLSKNIPFIYSSIDIRHAGFKIAPVDTNMFPAGFNNLNPKEKKKAAIIFKEFFEKNYQGVNDILLIAEDFTRNKYYFENIDTIINILKETGKNVILSTFDTIKTNEPKEFFSNTDKKLISETLVRNNDLLVTEEGIAPELIIINNDMTDGAPEIIQGLKQRISPPLGFGWYLRRKTSHFESYNNLANDFCSKFNLDPWLITTYYEKCGIVNFKNKIGIECIASKVDYLIKKIQRKYDKYNINEIPYVFIKSDKGTYGMGIMTARSGEDVLKMTKNIRKKMDKIKSGQTNSEVIIQEGVPTIDRAENNPCEPMVYLLGDKPIGFIYRINTDRDVYGNLNAKGMIFDSIEKYSNNLEYSKSLSVIAKIAFHAASWECYVSNYCI